MNRSISIFGLGYVGSVAAGCLARMGHRVIGVDLNPAKVDLLGAGRSPVVEPGLDELIAQGHKAGLIQSMGDGAAAVHDSDISLVCVGTPSQSDGALDIGQVQSVCREIGEALGRKGSFHLVALRSTVLPGTTEDVVVPTVEDASGLHLGSDFGVCVNPEFMREGSGITDFEDPRLTVIGAQDPAHAALLREMYASVAGPVFETSFATAEMIKHVGNAWHALKICFANEIGSLGRRLGVDTQSVMEMFVADTKLNISSEYLRPGFAFGGSCLPKDVSALTERGKDLDLRLPLLESVLASNGEHLDRATAFVRRTPAKTIAVLGLSFKPGTDDLRASPHVELVKRLLDEHHEVRLWDADVSFDRLIGANREFVESVLPGMRAMLTSELREAVDGADVVVIASRGLDLAKLRTLLRPEQRVLDLVNVERPRRLDDHPLYEGLCW